MNAVPEQDERTAGDTPNAPPPTTIASRGLSPAPPRPPGAPDLTTVLRRVVEAARDLVGADAASVLLYDHEAALFAPAAPSVAIGLDERWL